MIQRLNVQGEGEGSLHEEKMGFRENPPRLPLQIFDNPTISGNQFEQELLDLLGAVVET